MSSGADHRRHRRHAGFTLLELVVAITLFSFIVITVLADREKSIRMSGDARITQTVRYLAAAKIDEIRHDPSQFDESDTGDFEDLESDWQDFSDYTWESKVEQLVVVGNSDDPGADFLYDGDEDLDPVTTPGGEPLDPRYVGRLTLTVRFEPGGEVRPGLSITIVTFIPPEEEEEEGGS